MGRGPKAKRQKPVVQEPQPLDAFEADDQLPAEEQPKNVNKRYDVSCCSWGCVVRWVSCIGCAHEVQSCTPA